MNLKELKKNWDEWGKIDSLWSILTDTQKSNNKWNIDEFFETGEKEVNEVINYIESLNIKLSRKKALDFGCGVGRLTQALSNYFDEVYGVDISETMIDLAIKYNKYNDKCKYYVNISDDLRLFSDNSFDFIYSSITLQHIEPRYSINYIKEFLRILAYQGLLIFQLPSEKVRALTLKYIIPEKFLRLYRRIKNINKPIIDMYGIKKDEICKLLESNGGKILDIKQDNKAGKNWVSYMYCITKVCQEKNYLFSQKIP